MFAAPENRQRTKTLEGVPLKSCGVEFRMNEGDVVGEALDGFAVEELG